MLQSDPELPGVGLVIFDEFHERSLHADVGLALALQTRSLFRPDLRLLVMSATLDAGPVQELLADAVVLEAEGRQYTVDTRYRERPLQARIEEALAAQVRRAVDETEGDVLAFLPGAGEIHRSAELLRKAGLPDTVDVYPLFGDLSRQQQESAIAASAAGRRKIVLASAIAQTSLTIEGVRVVVDSGLMRVPRFSPRTGMTGLDTLRVTRDVAEQRRGRAGRTAPGTCYRLWTEAEDRSLKPRLSAEILDADLAPLALDLAVWGADPAELQWIDPPPASAIAQARTLLHQLDALDEHAAATAHGRSMAKLGLHPRLAHMLLRARDHGLTELACDLAALLGERDVLQREGEAPDADLRLRLEVLRRSRERNAADSAPHAHRVHRGRLRRVREEARHWRRVCNGGASRRGAPEPSRAAQQPPESIEAAGELLALAFPDRIARRRESTAPAAGGGPSAARFLLRNGSGASLADSQALGESEWIVAGELADRGREARIFLAAPIARERVEELFEDQIEEHDEISWVAERDRVEARRCRRLGALVVSETAIPHPDPDRVARALLEGIRERGLRVLPWQGKNEQLRERLQFLHQAEPEAWPDVSLEHLEATLEHWLAPHLGSARRLGDLASIDLSSALWSLAGWQKRQALEELAPTHLEVPSGSRIALDYSDPTAPALAVRLQEVFGWLDTPRIAGGRVAVTIRLLSPAQRPVQVTRDLASFWRHTYFEVKKDLKGRYPKHYWPDDPLTAEATRRVRPR
jgi:ATP-dependent helicase HrpB